MPESQQAFSLFPLPALTGGGVVGSLPALPDRVFSLDVVNVPVKEILYALLRDAGVEADIHPALHDKISLVAKNQTVPELLQRIKAMTDIRVRQEAGRLIIEPDRPYTQRYALDYLNIQRALTLRTRISSSLLHHSAHTGRGNDSDNNTSSLALQAEQENRLWPRLKGSLCQILLSMPSRWHQPDCANDKAESRDIVLYPEVGLLVVNATDRQHVQISALLQEVTQCAKRQVLIEATIVEVELDEHHEAGVDWSLLMSNGVSAGGKFLAGNLAMPPFVFLARDEKYQLQGLIKALETFGSARVLSSPRIVALNNQAAILKVVNEEVYFTLQVKEAFNRHGEIQKHEFESQLHTVPVGLVLNVTPQIGATGSVALHVRPSITSIGGYKEDPAVSLYAARHKVTVKSQVPVLQIREFDSMLSIPDQHVAILGGLIRDELHREEEGIPWLRRIPVLKWLFQHQSRRTRKSELIVLLRPQIVDYVKPAEAAERHLPSENHIADKAHAYGL